MNASIADRRREDLNGKDAFSKIMKDEAYNRSILSMYLDESPQNLNQQMSPKVVDLKVERFTELLNCMGWTLEFARLPYKKASHKYITNVMVGVADHVYRSNKEKMHRNSLFYAMDEGFEILDNRGAEPLYFTVSSEEEMYEKLNELCGRKA